jgi:outer membrane lipoprotein-sorting protein
MLLTLALLLMAAPVLAGCGGQVSAPEIIQHLKDTAASTQDVHMVVDLTVDMTAAATAAPATKDASNPLSGLELPKSGKATVELWYKKPNLMRAEIKSTDMGDYAGMTLVNDGQTLWAYDPSHKMAYKLDTSLLKGAGKMANIPADIQDLLNDPDLTAMLDRVLSYTDATVAGTETVAGFNTYKLTLSPKADTGLASAALGIKATMWVDQQTWTVVKLDVNTTQGSAGYSAQQIEFNRNIPDSTFKFTLPAGARGIDLSLFMPRQMTLDEARTAAAKSFTLLTPATVPAGTTLTGVMGLPMNRGYVLTYGGSASLPSVVVYEGLIGSGTAPALGAGMGGNMGDLDAILGGAKPDGAQVQAVQVRGVTGQAFTKAAEGTGRGGTFVTWQEKGSTLRLGVGGDITLDEALRIAESLTDK